jgi:hypothetical protein
MAIFDRDQPMYHGTAADEFDEFMSHRPVFFTSNRRYAEVYMEKGGATSRIIEARLDVSRPFVGDCAADIDFYNDEFIPWMRSVYPRLSDGLEPISIRQGVPFVWVEDFFVHLRRTARAGTSPYDGMIVDEGGTGNAVGGAGVTVVPLWPFQITSIAAHIGK